jgi:hypothetical protein
MTGEKVHETTEDVPESSTLQITTQHSPEPNTSQETTQSVTQIADDVLTLGGNAPDYIRGRGRDGLGGRISGESSGQYGNQSQGQS